jgi:hypothetical protein
VAASQQVGVVHDQGHLHPVGRLELAEQPGHVGLEGRGWLQAGTSVALWELVPMELGCLRIERGNVT